MLISSYISYIFAVFSFKNPGEGGCVGLLVVLNDSVLRKIGIKTRLKRKSVLLQIMHRSMSMRDMVNCGTGHEEYEGYGKLWHWEVNFPTIK